MKRTTVFSVAVLVLLHAGMDLYAQRRVEERTLLWEISGNGLSAPSYLYGTMHVYDKGVFKFSDSVLLKLQQCSAFAAEVVLDQSMRDVILYYRSRNSMGTSDTVAVVDASDPTFVGPRVPASGQATRHSPSGMDRGGSRSDGMADGSVQGESGRDARAERSSPRRISVDLFEDQGKRKPGDNPVMLDAYLSRLAKKEGKRMIGLEMPGEQLDAFNPRSDRAEFWRFYFSRPGLFRKISEGDLQQTLLRYYKRGEVGKLQALMQEYLPPTLYKRFITVRNHRMAERAEPHMREQPTFIAVGAAHLGGKEGLLQLFREKGFTVRPVRAVYTGLAKQYREPEHELEWTRFASCDGAYSVELPSEPISARDLAGVVGGMGENDISSFLWLDVLTGINYAVGHYDEHHDTELALLRRGMGRYPASALDHDDADRIKGTPISVSADGVEGVEIAEETPEGSIKRTRRYQRGQRLYVLKIETTPALAYSEDVTRFFSSFHLHDVRPSELQEYRSPKGEFSVALPGKPVTWTDTSLQGFDSYTVYLSSRDRNSGALYQASYCQFSQVWQASSPSSFFDENVKLFSDFPHDSLVKVESIEWKGLPGRDVEVMSTTSGYSHRARYLLQGDRLYCLTVSDLRSRIYSEQNTAFLESFKLHGELSHGDIFSDKKERILADLISDDSLRVVRASNRVEYISLTQRDLPRLHNILRQLAGGDEGRRAAAWHILGSLAKLGDGSTTEVVRDLYPSLAPIPYVRRAALSLLVSIGTSESLALFTKLIVQDTTHGWDEMNHPFMEFQGNDILSRRIYPGILDGLDNKNHRSALYRLTVSLLEDGTLSPAVLLPYADVIRRRMHMLMQVQAGASAYENYEYKHLLPVVVQCAGYLPGSDDLRRALADLLAGGDRDIALAALTATLRQGDSVSSTVMQRLVSDRAAAVALYRSLETMGKQDAFPRSLRSQRMFAEAFLATWLARDRQLPDSIRYLGERDTTVWGMPGRVFLFAFRMRPESAWQVGISGLQPLDRQRLNAHPEIVGSEYTYLDSADIDGHFSALLRDGLMFAALL